MTEAQVIARAILLLIETFPGIRVLQTTRAVVDAVEAMRP